MHNEVVVRFFKIACEHFWLASIPVFLGAFAQHGPTISTDVQFDDASNPNIDHPQEALVLLLELLLVEDLYSKDAVLGDLPV